MNSTLVVLVVAFGPGFQQGPAGLQPPASYPRPGTECAVDVLHQDLGPGSTGARLRSPDGAAVLGGPLSFVVEAAPPNAVGVIFHGHVDPVFDPVLGATLYSAAPMVVVPFTTDANGVSSPLLVEGAVPPNLCGEDAAVQAAVQDPGAMGGVAVTNGLRVRVGSSRIDRLLPARLYPVDLRPSFVVVEDFDGDGGADVAVAGTGGIAVFLGERRGTLRATWRFATTNGNRIATGDFDEDGNADLVSVLTDIHTFVGDGKGRFTGPLVTPYGSTTGTASRALVADMDLDGHLDLVVGEEGSSVGNFVRVFPGLGDGTFGPAISTAPGDDTEGMAVGDFDGDGIPDLAWSAEFLSPFGTRVFGGNGDGTFGSPLVLPQGFTRWLAVGDVTSDGIDDVVSDDKVHPGNGDGTFATAISYPGPSTDGYLVDADGDGRTDLVGGTEVFLGDGAGGFGAPVGDALLTAQSVADLDRDGYVDLIGSITAGVPHAGSLGTVFLGPDGFRDIFEATPGGPRPNDVEVADLDGDGALDIVTANAGDNRGILHGGNLSVFPGLSAGFVGSPDTYVFGVNPVSVRAADLDGDGAPELLVPYMSFGTVGDLRLYPGNGDATFATPSAIPSWAAERLDLGDFDGDGDLDLVAAETGSDEVLVLEGLGNGTFEPLGQGLRLASGDAPVWVATRDLDGDGALELLSVNAGSGDVSVFAGVGDGTFAAGVTHAVGPDPVSLAVGDLDRDGVLDLVVPTHAAGVHILRGTDGLRFARPAVYVHRSQPERVLLDDFDGNGVLDLALGGRRIPAGVDSALRNQGVALAAGRGDGTFDRAAYFLGGLGSNPLDGGVLGDLASGDFDGEGIPDLVTVDWSISSPRMAILVNGLGE